MILFGEGSLRTAVRQFIAHYHAERNHQGIGNLLIVPDRSLTHNDVKAASAECSITMTGPPDYSPHVSFWTVRHRRPSDRLQNRHRPGENAPAAFFPSYRIKPEVGASGAIKPAGEIEIVLEIARRR